MKRFCFALTLLFGLLPVSKAQNRLSPKLSVEPPAVVHYDESVLAGSSILFPDTASIKAQTTFVFFVLPVYSNDRVPRLLGSYSGYVVTINGVQEFRLSFPDGRVYRCSFVSLLNFLRDSLQMVPVPVPR